MVIDGYWWLLMVDDDDDGGGGGGDDIPYTDIGTHLHVQTYYPYLHVAYTLCGSCPKKLEIRQNRWLPVTIKLDDFGAPHILWSSGPQAGRGGRQWLRQVHAAVVFFGSGAAQGGPNTAAARCAHHGGGAPRMTPNRWLMGIVENIHNSMKAKIWLIILNNGQTSHLTCSFCQKKVVP